MVRGWGGRDGLEKREGTRCDAETNRCRADRIPWIFEPEARKVAVLGEHFWQPARISRHADIVNGVAGGELVPSNFPDLCEFIIIFARRNNHGTPLPTPVPFTALPSARGRPTREHENYNRSTLNNGADFFFPRRGDSSFRVDY